MIFHNLSDEEEKFIPNTAFNPFGPLMIKGLLKDETHAQLLNCVNEQLSLKKSSDTIVRSGDNYQKNSIINGIMQEIDFDLQKDSYNNIVLNTISDLTGHYFKTLFGFVNEDQEVAESMNLRGSIVSCWLVVMKKGDFHILHDHAEPGSKTAISGSIYLKVPEDLPEPQGCINWVNNMPGTMLKNDMWVHKPIEKEYVIWPAWLKHHVYPFYFDQDRIMISFNSTMPGDI